MVTRAVALDSKRVTNYETRNVEDDCADSDIDSDCTGDDAGSDVVHVGTIFDLKVQSDRRSSGKNVKIRKCKERSPASQMEVGPLYDFY